MSICGVLNGMAKVAAGAGPGRLCSERRYRRKGSNATAMHDLAVDLFQFGLVLRLFVRKRHEQVANRAGLGRLGSTGNIRPVLGGGSGER